MPQKQTVRAAPERMLLLVGFAGVVAAALIRHEMWLDEMIAWLIARDAHNLAGLFANMHGESHPALWYLVLYPVTRVTSDPRAMQALHLIIACASAALIAWSAPFSPLERWLLAFSYLFVYEFAVISRAYAAGVLLALAACTSYVRARPPVLMIAVLLALLANTSVYGAIVAVALSAGMLAGRRCERGPRLAVAALVVAAGTIAGVAAATPRSDVAFGHESHTRLDVRRVAYTLDAAWAAYVPLPDFGAASPWNSNVMFGTWVPSGRAPTAWPALGGAALIAASLAVLWRNRAAFVTYAVGAAAICALIYLKYSGGMRHHGHLFVLFVLAMWLARSSDDRAPRQRPAPWFAALLVPQVIAGGFFLVEDFREPFSVSVALARYIASVPHPAGVVVAHTEPLSYAGPVLSGYLRRPLLYAYGDGVVRGSFPIYTAERFRYSAADAVLAQLERFALDRGSDVYVVTQDWESPQLGTLKARFDHHLELDEGRIDVYLYHPATNLH
jgi:hypothetical protein